MQSNIDNSGIVLRPVNSLPGGRLIGLDFGTRRVGVALTDELQVSSRAIGPIARTNWKALLQNIRQLIAEYDAKGIVVGLPTNMDGTHGPAAAEAMRLARNLKLSVTVRVFMQDERLTSEQAIENLRAESRTSSEIESLIDGEAARIIIDDCLSAESKTEVLLVDQLSE